MSTIVAITVSTNYDDLLDIILPQNHRFFNTWYIITHKDDAKTIEVVNKYNYSNVKLVYFDFYAGNCRFNQGGAIRHVQDILASMNYNGYVLHLDSDIYLPDNFSELLLRLETHSLYGVSSRNDYFSYDHFKAGKADRVHSRDHMFQGFFQLYVFSINTRCKQSENCSQWDLDFHKHFKHKINIPNLHVSHLGHSGVHWTGRKNKEADFAR
uniref:Glycosyltransferase 2-like domain-containing protein n=1 Tax=viral metagenome TaxID=1070528 RepID=A0A6C0I846_9ZZZZ